MLANSKSYSDRDLGELALEDARKGGKGRSNAILTLPMEHLRDHYLSMPPEEAAIFEKPCRLEAFIATGAESIRQGVHGIAWDTHVRVRAWDFRLEEIDFPVRLLHGEADRNVSVAVARKVAASIPGCRATFYEGEGHFSTALNHLDEVFAALG